MSSDRAHYLVGYRCTGQSWQLKLVSWSVISGIPGWEPLITGWLTKTCYTTSACDSKHLVQQKQQQHQKAVNIKKKKRLSQQNWCRKNRWTVKECWLSIYLVKNCKSSFFFSISFSWINCPIRKIRSSPPSKFNWLVLLQLHLVLTMWSLFSIAVIKQPNPIQLQSQNQHPSHPQVIFPQNSPTSLTQNQK